MSSLKSSLKRSKANRSSVQLLWAPQFGGNRGKRSQNLDSAGMPRSLPFEKRTGVLLRLLERKQRPRLGDWPSAVVKPAF